MEEREIGAEAPSLGARLRSVRTWGSFLLAAGILLWAFRQARVEWGQVGGYLRGTNWGLVLLAWAFFYLNFPVRAWRWRRLLEGAGFEPGQAWPGWPALAEIIFLSWFANCLVPAKLGDALRGVLLKQRCGVSFSRTLGTVVAERILDMLTLFLLLLGSGWAAFGGELPPVVRKVFLLGTALALALLAGLGGLRVLGRWVRRLLPTGRWAEAYGRLEEGVLLSFAPRQLPLLLGLTLPLWLFEAGRLYLVTRALGGVPVGGWGLFFLALAAALLTAVPLTPAGLGVVESSVMGVLILFGVDPSLAAAVALVDRLVSYWSLVGLGALWFGVRQIRGTA